MHKNRARIKDLAEELGLSTSTISRALTNDKRISERVRNEVAILAKRWGYTKNPFAVNLHQNKSNHIGLILPEFTHHFFSLVLKGVDKVVSEKGYNLIVNTHNDDHEKELKAAHALNSLLVEGMIVCYASNNEDNEGFKFYKDSMQSGVPVVFFDRLCEDIKASYVITDDFNGAISAIDHLVKTGCRKIGYLCGPDDLSTNFNREMGFREGLRKNGIPGNEDLKFSWDKDIERWKATCISFLRDNNIDGILCFSDYIAYDVLCLLQDLNIKVPDQISIIGFAGEPISAFTRPRISTVTQPAELIGKRAAEILFSHLENMDSQTIYTEVLPTQLTLRDSTRTFAML
ncbi:MAG: LacI family DNA-binding transcriptional regulator [Chryseolinea sp.]